MRKKILAPFLGITALFTFVGNAFAFGEDWGACTQKVTDANGNANEVATLSCVPVIFKNVIEAALVFAAVVAVFFIILGGIRIITSGGDPKQVGEARKTLTWAIVGLLIIFLSFFIINVIAGVTGVSCITSFGFDNCK